MNFLLVRENNIDSDNMIFTDICLKIHDNEKVKVTKNFDDKILMGTAVLHYKGGAGLEFELNDGIENMYSIDKLYPALKCNIDESGCIKEENGTKTYNAIDGLSIGLCTSPNVDLHVHTIGEQKIEKRKENKENQIQ